jgi:exopolysaccharide production protein ExoZ
VNLLARSPVPRLDAIQWLRALAALAIAVHHALHEAALAGGSASLQGILPLEAGVDLFFVISGFVMVHASRDMFGSPAAILPFLRRRLARIAPIYWAATALFLIPAFLGAVSGGRAPPTLAEIAASLAFLPYQRPDGVVQPLYGLGWTLNYEMFFYLVFALALPLRRERAVPTVLLGLMALVAIGQFVPPSLAAPWFWTRSIILEFGFGMLIGHMALSGVRPTPATAWALAGAALALLALGKLAPALLPDRALLYGLPATLLVMAALAVENAGSGRPAARLLTGLGDASYALYLLHPFVLRALALTGGSALAGVSPLLFAAVGVTLAAAAAMIVWRWFEKPLTRALQGPKPGP